MSVPAVLPALAEMLAGFLT